MVEVHKHSKFSYIGQYSFVLWIFILHYRQQYKKHTNTDKVKGVSESYVLIKRKYFLSNSWCLESDKSENLSYCYYTYAQIDTHGHSIIRFTIHHTLTSPASPLGYILRRIMLDSFPPPHVLNLVSHLCVFKITAREILATVAGGFRVWLFFGCICRRQRTHGKTSLWKRSIVHLCVSVLPPLPSCFYTYILHPCPSPSCCSLPPFPPPPFPSSSLLSALHQRGKHMNTVDVAFRCSANLTERNVSYCKVVVWNHLSIFRLCNIM